jgi:hypothetical protein
MLINPQNEFCSYENLAFQAKKHPRRQKSIAVEDFNSPSRLCLKGNNLHTPGQRSADKDNKRLCLKGRTIAAEVKMPATTKKQTKFVIGNS